MTTPNNDDWFSYYQSDHHHHHHPPLPSSSAAAINYSDSTIISTTTTTNHPINSQQHVSSQQQQQQQQLSPDTSGRVSKPIRRRSRASRRTPTTLLNTDPSNFRAMVQQFTGAPTVAITSETTTSTGLRPGYPISFEQGQLGQQRVDDAVWGNYYNVLDPAANHGDHHHHHHHGSHDGGYNMF